MKILVLTHGPKHLINPYVGTLMDEVMAIDPEIEISYGYRHFWTDRVFEFDAVHNMWPDVLRRRGHSLADIEQRLKTIKAHGVKVISTCHNLTAHMAQADDAYGLLYRYSDMIFHLGGYSYRLFKEQYPKALHVLGAHHLYDTLYADNKKKRTTTASAPIRVVCIGKFRNDQERDMVRHLAEEMPELSFTCPSYCRTWREKVSLWWHKTLPKNMHIDNAHLPHRKLVKLCLKSDIILIQRISTLNSGNITLGMLFGLDVVGPRIGNMGEMVESVGCPTFDPQSADSLRQAMEEAVRQVKHNRGAEIQRLAFAKYSTRNVARMMDDAYRLLLMKSDPMKVPG